jgi:hypothetical protein
MIWKTPCDKSADVLMLTKVTRLTRLTVWVCVASIPRVSDAEDGADLMQFVRYRQGHCGSVFAVRNACSTGNASVQVYPCGIGQARKLDPRVLSSIYSRSVRSN